MKYFFTIILSVFALSFTQIQAQRTKPVLPEGKGQTTIDLNEVKLIRQNWNALPQVNPSIFDPPVFNVTSVGPLVAPVKGQTQLTIIKDETTKLPTWIKGNPDIPATSSRSASEVSQTYLNTIKNLIQIERPADEFALQSVREDKNGHQHIRFQQMYEGLKVFGSEIILHENAGNVYLFNGRYHATPTLESIAPQVNEADANSIVQNAVEVFTSFKTLNALELQLMAGEQLETELVIYHATPSSAAQLVWHITARPNIVAHYEYFVDANTGEIIQHYNGICQIHGGRCTETPQGHDHTPEISLEMPAAEKSVDFNMLPPGPEVANATDLAGINRSINTYEDGGTFFMIDASRSMFNASLSDIPNEPVGAIWTIDGNNDSPQNNSFQPSHVTSGNNNWNDPTAVSAHYNGGEAYEYFQNTFNRNSINGQGGTIVSLINITDSDGSQMDNAYWNGNAMFYGNGNQAFDAPLAKALDVAGHEMAHGVIQSTANLVYQNEPGALNESYADIFGAMIDRDDWKIGEEVASSVFPSGTMRDMANPHNGGNSLNDFYWQPDHYSERYTGTQDNGGVHINSGIPNHAYYLFATSNGVGKGTAEDVYYEVLENYLTASSNFADLRNAVVQVATAESASIGNAAAAAFDEVGIEGAGGSGPPPENQENEGDDYILYSDSGLSNIMNLNGDSSPNGVLSTNNHISKPSVSDNGSIIDYVGADNHIWEIVIDWNTGVIENEYTLSTDPIWRNLATSKDGSKIAAVTTDLDNMVFVIDFNSGTSQWFELYNPTFSQDITTGDVDFADVLEFDATGEFLMYDAQSTISGDFGADITYWDIGFMRVWNNGVNTFGDGEISKLFSGLPENVSVGNPTFSKNSPYIIALDVIEGTTSGTNYTVLGVNLETNDQGVIWENNTLGYPSYSSDDDEVLFSNVNNNVDIIGKVGMAADKINADGSNGTIVVEDAIWAVWYATGERVLVDTKEPILADDHLLIYPNPFNSQLTLEYSALNSGTGTIQIFDMIGNLKYSVNTELSSGANKRNLEVSKLAAGTYLLQLRTADGVVTRKLSKF